MIRLEDLPALQKTLLVLDGIRNNIEAKQRLDLLQRTTDTSKIKGKPHSKKSLNYQASVDYLNEASANIIKAINSVVEAEMEGEE